MNINARLPLFMQKEGLFLHSLKKLRYVTRNEFTHSDSDDDICFTCTLAPSSLKKSTFLPSCIMYYFSI